MWSKEGRSEQSKEFEKKKLPDFRLTNVLVLNPNVDVLRD